MKWCESTPSMVRCRFNVALDRIHVKLWSFGISFGLSDNNVTMVDYMVKEKRIAIRVLVESTTIQVPTFFAGSQSYGAIWTCNNYA
ncbi:hypothetical protein V6N12_042553 [Hibiscus sabdariffa]|uniref:Uncharacterized protein n=1 Tax=Hibiscus sabdariffa TaxID=183260 RepID=A0ABR2EGR4_9ROSI